jgi:peptide/nickel transport system substrate-binding protein
MSDEPMSDGRLTRRRFLQGAVATGVALGLPSTAGATRWNFQAAAPKRGGRLRVGFVGEGAQETLDPGLQVASIDAGRAANLYDTLLRVVPPGDKLSLELAEEFSPANSKGTAWDIRLRRGVTWHNGEPLTTDDVIYTIKRSASSPKYLGYHLVEPIALSKIRKLDERTIRLPLKRPVAVLPWNFAGSALSILPDGFKNFAKPMGTGPFVFVSWKVGQNSLFRRNPNYWKSGLPYVDELEFDSISDPNARVNALLSGQVDAAEQLSFSQTQQYQKSSKVKILQSPGSVIVPMTMAVDLAPFKDVRVRQAFRLIAGRPEILAIAQAGIGEIGNDLFGKHAAYYNAALPQRHQDIDQAKFLLKKAGAENLSVTLYSSTVVAGMLESANVFAQQAAKAGVKVNVENGPADTYYSDHYLKAPFMQTQWSGTPIWTWMNAAVLSTAKYNETHWRVPAFDKLVAQAEAEANPVKAQDLWSAAQKMLWESGGYIVWGFQPYLDALSPNVQGAVPNAYFNLSNYDFRHWWKA